MKKLLSFIACICLAGAFLCACAAQGDTAPTADGMLTAVTDESGKVIGYERRYHNDNGAVTRWDQYDENETYTGYVLYEYDSSDRLAKETTYSADGIGQSYYAYSYDADGRLSEKDYCTAKEGSERILYTDGVESERLTYDREDNLIKYELYRDGSWVESTLPTEETTEE